MLIDKYTEIIMKSPLFCGIDQDELGEVLSAGMITDRKKGEFLFHQGNQANYLFVLLKGMVRLVKYSPEGEKVIIRHVSPGEVIGLIAVLGGFKYPLSTEVIDDATLWVCPGHEFHKLLYRFPSLALNCIQLLTGRIRELLHKIEELGTEKVEQRLAKQVIRLHHQFQTGDNPTRIRITKEDLAQMTGTTLYTVSRIVRQWEKKGLVKTGRGWLIVEDLNGLKRTSEDKEENPTVA